MLSLSPATIYSLNKKVDNKQLLYPRLYELDRATDGWGKQLIGIKKSYSFPCKYHGADKSSKKIMSFLFGKRYKPYTKIYKYVLNARALPNNKNKLLAICGIAPNGLIHLGHFQHITAIHDTKIRSTIVSFNDIEAQLVRNANYDKIQSSIESFNLVLPPNATKEVRTKIPELMDLFNKLLNIIKQKDYFIVFGRDLNKQERFSINLQAAAYLYRSLKDPKFIPIGFDGIEELKRMKYINYIAQQKLGLPGGVFFISPQIPGWRNTMKMGKSNPIGSLKIGDSLKEIINNIKKLKSCLASRYLLCITIFLFSRRREHILPISTNIKILKELAIRNIKINHSKKFPLIQN